MSIPVSRSVSGGPRLLLRLEAVAVLSLAVWLYHRGGYSWAWFAATLLVPDLSFAGYLAGPRVGAAAYNAAHSYLGPALAAAGAAWVGAPLTVPLIWAAHIALDRALGYGLKYASGFGDTHLGRLRGAEAPTVRAAG